MIHFRIDIFGWRRVSELYEDNQRKNQKIRELQTGQRFQQIQLKGYGKDFEQLLREREELKDKLRVLAEDRDEWFKRYKASEDARKDLGDKLVRAARENARLEEALEVIRGPLQKGTGILEKRDEPGNYAFLSMEESTRRRVEQERRIATAPAELRNDSREGGAEA